MVILDSNVVSAIMRRPAEPVIVSWLDRQALDSIWTTAVSVFEIRYGIEILPPSRRKVALYSMLDAFLEEINHRIAPFDSTAAYHCAELVAVRKRKGRPVDLRDSMIAGIAIANKASLATRNVSHFQEVSPLINPWAS